jgi:hypothetical protein
MKKMIVVIMLVIALVVGTVAVASAGVTGTVVITAQPYYLCMTLTFYDAHDASWDLGSIGESTTCYWDDEGAYPGAAPSFPLDIADCAGNITNCATVGDITVECADFTGGGGWNLTTGAPGADTVQVTAYLEGCASEAAGTEVDNGPVTLMHSLAAATSTGVELSLETGTFSDIVAKSSTGVVFTIIADTP